MAHDPFAPPRADLAVVEERGPMPPRVQVAVATMSAAVAVSLVLGAFMWTGIISVAGQSGADPVQVLVGVATVAFYAFLAWKVFQGRNWARWVFAIIVGLALTGVFLSAAFTGNVLRAMPGIYLAGIVVRILLQVAAAAMLFTADAARWFRGASPPG